MMDDTRAAELLADEAVRVKALLADLDNAGVDDRAGASEQGDMADPSESLVSEGEEEAVAEALRERLAAIVRAQDRLRDGTYGRSVRSGAVIPDARLEADPAAELTVDEALES
jgi:DnaK suppressor protein